MFKIGTFGVYCRILLPILTLLASLSLKIYPTKAISSNSPQQQLPSNRELRAQVESREGESSDESDRSALARAVLAEINRARTDPQGYAAWLQEQKKYYDGILLKLPGEKPVRTNRGLQALTEAIDFLKEQEPLPNLAISDELNTTAAARLAQIDTTQTGEDFKNISYGKVTASGIVMHLIVDDGFPDRRHRTSIFNPNFNLAGIICQNNQLYDNICAIAYEGESIEVAAQPDGENNQSSPGSDATAETLPPPAQSNPPNNVEVTSENNNESQVNSASNDLPDVPEIQVPTKPATPEAETEIAIEDSATEISESETNNESQTELETEESSATETSDVEANNESVAENVPESESSVESENPPRLASLLQKTERGVLEEGDETIPNDGSFYDSYPLEGNAGDSFIISLESQDFDTFVAILDSEGNILDQNDDISEENSNSRLRITLPSNGVYNVIVNAYDKGGKGRYTLTVRR